MIALLIAAQILAGPIEARVTEIVDGDTIKVEATIWLGQKVTTSVRLRGVDTPEIRGAKCPEELELALQAREFVRERISGRVIRMTEIGRGTYAGRVVAWIWVGDENLSEALIENGLGRVWTGKRESWC